MSHGSRPNARQAAYFSIPKKKKFNKIKAFTTLTLILDLHMLPANPRPCISSFAISLIILHKTASITQQTSIPQPLPCKAEAKKVHQDISIYFLESGEEVGVFKMLFGRLALHLASSLTFLQCTSPNFTLQWISVHYPTQTRPIYPPLPPTPQKTELNNYRCIKIKAKFLCIFSQSFYFRYFATC